MKEETGESSPPFNKVSESDTLLGTHADSLLGFNPHPDFKMSSGEVLNVS